MFYDKSAIGCSYKLDFTGNGSVHPRTEQLNCVKTQSKNWTRLEEIQINDNKGTPEKTLMPIHSATDSTVILIVRWIRSVNSGLEIPQVT